MLALFVPPLLGAPLGDDSGVLDARGAAPIALPASAAARQQRWPGAGRVSSGQPMLTPASVALRMAAAGLNPDDTDDPDPNCPQYTAISDTHLDNEYCKNNCNYGYCPRAMCKCDEALLAAKEAEDAAAAKQAKAAGGGKAGAATGKALAAVALAARDAADDRALVALEPVRTLVGVAPAGVSPSLVPLRIPPSGVDGRRHQPCPQAQHPCAGVA